MKKSLHIFAAFILLFEAGNLSAQQWKLAASSLITFANRPNNSGGVLIYHDGILWAGSRDIWMSPDTGKTWSLRTPFTAFSINPCVKDICFYDDQIGLATTQNGEIYITKDQGLSWTQHIPNNPFRYKPSIESACFVGSPNTIIACTYSGDRYVSRDGGMTWQITQADSLASHVIAGNGGTAYIIGGFDRAPSVGSHLYETNDFGATWFMHSGIFHWDSYSFARDWCDTNIFYVANDDLAAKSDKASRVFVTPNTGSSWNETDPHIQPFHCGSISAAPNAVFVQTFSGISRTTDQGKTWKNIGGPPNITDTRFVAAINNNIVVAIDTGVSVNGINGPGSVWVTFNSGGDSLSVIDGSKLSIQTAPKLKTDTIGGTVAVPISVGGLSSQQDLDIIIHYDTNLIYKGTYRTGNAKLDITVESWNGRSRIHIQGANSSGILAYSYFDVFSDSSKKPVVTFDSLIILTAIVPCNNTLVFSATSEITPVSGCEARILSRYMRDHIEPQLTINPNPTNGDVSITSSRDLGEVNVSIYDMLGVKRGESIINLGKNAAAKLVIPPVNGVYSVRVKSAAITHNLRVVVNR